MTQRNARGGDDNGHGRGGQDPKRESAASYERLTDDPYVDASDVTVEVKDGAVTLAGSVTDRRMKHRIEDIAWDRASGKDIRNEVRVTPA